MVQGICEWFFLSSILYLNCYVCLIACESQACLWLTFDYSALKMYSTLLPFAKEQGHIIVYI